MTCKDCQLYKGEQQCYRYPPNANGSRSWVKPTDPACGEFQLRPATPVAVAAPVIERIVPQAQASTVEQTKAAKRK